MLYCEAVQTEMKILTFGNFSLSVCVTAGHINLEVEEYLLQHRAEVNAQDLGGQISLYNAASYRVRKGRKASK